MRLGRSFTVLWSANAFSNLADGLAFISMPLLAASMTDDARLVAGLATVYAAVRLIVALPIGVWVDRFDRRSLLVVANLMRGLVLIGLAFSIQLDVSSLVALYVTMAVIGTLESTADNAAVAILPSLVDRRTLDSANGRVQAVQIVADEFVGPPLGGLLFAFAASVPVFAMGGLWAVAGLIALALPVRRMTWQVADAEAQASQRSVYTEAREGIVWLVKHRTVGTLALIGALASVGYMLPFSILVLVAQHRLGLDGTGYGILLAFSAVGGLLGSFLAPRVRRRVGYRCTIVTSLLLGALTLGALTMTTHPVIAGMLLALYILHAVVWNVCSLSLRQVLVPDELLGRVGAAVRVLGLIGLAVGSALGGLLGTIDLRIPIALGAMTFAVCCVVGAYRLQTVDEEINSATQ